MIGISSNSFRLQNLCGPQKATTNCVVKTIDDIDQRKAKVPSCADDDDQPAPLYSCQDLSSDGDDNGDDNGDGDGDDNGDDDDDDDGHDGDQPYELNYQIMP